MNVYEKLLNCRLELKQAGMKKSGWNPYSKFEYYDLKDFLGPIMDLCSKYKLLPQITYTQEMATLNIINIEKPEETIIFTSPMSTANLTACHEVQNLGAVETYERRYLYITAFEIIEPDSLDSTTGSEKNKQQEPQKKLLSDAQVNRLYAKAGDKGYGKDVVAKQVKKRYGVENINELTKQQYDEVCAGYDNLQ